MALVARAVASPAATTVTLVADAAAAGGAPAREATVAHDRHDPDSWWIALQRAFAEVAEVADVAGVAGPGDGVASLTVAASPGVVVLDADRRPLWVAHPGDVDAGPDAGWLRTQLDGADAWTAAIGRAPTGADAISALSWLHRSEPAVWARLALVASPLAVLLERLTGRLVTSSDDAASTGYWSPAGHEYRLDLLAVVDRDRDWSGALPAVVPTGDEVGTWQGRPVVAG